MRQNEPPHFLLAEPTRGCDAWAGKGALHALYIDGQRHAFHQAFQLRLCRIAKIPDVVAHGSGRTSIAVGLVSIIGSFIAISGLVIPTSTQQPL